MKNSLTKEFAAANLPDGMPEFWKRLNLDPLEVKKDPQGFEYIPIDVLQYTMDYVFGAAMHSTHEAEFTNAGSFGTTRSGSTMVCEHCTIKIEAIHPVTNYQTWQVGIATGYYTEKWGKLKNHRQALAALAYKNGVKKWGRIFGRHLNRKDQENIYLGLFEEDIEQALKTMEDIDSLTQFYKDLSKNEQIAYKGIFSDRKNQLSKSK